jgi:preprotein translocase subunit YajC
MTMSPFLHSLSLLLLQDAPPTGGTSSGTGPLIGQLAPFLIVGVLFFVLLILPERKKQKLRTSMLSALKKGDRVMTSSGIFGTVVSLSEEVVVLQVADGVRLRFTRSAVQTVVEGEQGSSLADEKAEPSKA